MGVGAILNIPPESAADRARFAAAHHALLADPDLQTSLHRAKPPTPPPAWLTAFGNWLSRVFRPVGRLLEWIGNLMPNWPVARFLLWTLIAAAAAALLWLIFVTIRDRGWGRKKARATGVGDDDEAADSWQPDAAPARQWLEEADALAADGQYAEAVHHLLLRSLEDIAHRRPGLLRPALTSREVSRISALPPRARQLFANIAMVVERGLFGGRTVLLADWQDCRAAYADFLRSPSWRLRG